MTYPPAFIYIYDPTKSAASALRTVLRGLTDQATSPYTAYASINAVSCFTPRLFYDTVLNALARWSLVWENGCENWVGTSADGQRWNENIDTFMHGIRAVYSQMQADVMSSTTARNITRGRGKGKAKEELIDSTACRLVLAIERAERLKVNMPELMAPLTRLAELAQIDVVTIFLSEARWEDIRPSLGASPDPYYVEAPTTSKQATIEMLASSFPLTPSSTGRVDADAYHPALRPLYMHFLEALYSIVGPFTHDPYEMAYIAAARWPGFVQPLLDEHRLRVEEYRARQDQGEQDAYTSDDDAEQLLNLMPPAEDIRIRLIRFFTPSFTGALEVVYPRLMNATDWARANMPPPDLLYAPPSQVSQQTTAREVRDLESSVEALSRLAKFVLVAAFLASTNPPKTDLRMFGRGPDERARRRRRKGGSPSKPRPGATGGAVKIPQRLLGPMAFPLERLLAILGALLEENDVETRPQASHYTQPGEYTDAEISRVATYAQIMELTSMRLLVRASPVDKQDMSSSFKCGISYEMALKLGKDVGIILSDIMWESI